MGTLARETVKLSARYEEAGDGWVLATIPEVPGAISQGRTRKEARENIMTPSRSSSLRTISSRAIPPGDNELLTLTISE